MIFLFIYSEETALLEYANGFKTSTPGFYAAGKDLPGIVLTDHEKVFRNK